jgi:hypothetical protein
MRCLQEIEDEATMVEKGLEQEAVVLEKDLEQGLRSFGKGFTVLEQRLETELTAEEKALQKEIRDELKAAEKLLEKVRKLFHSTETFYVCSFQSISPTAAGGGFARPLLFVPKYQSNGCRWWFCSTPFV